MKSWANLQLYRHIYKIDKYTFKLEINWYELKNQHWFIHSFTIFFKKVNAFLIENLNHQKRNYTCLYIFIHIYIYKRKKKKKRKKHVTIENVFLFYIYIYIYVCIYICFTIFITIYCVIVKTGRFSHELHNETSRHPITHPCLSDYVVSIHPNFPLPIYRK